MMLPSRKIIWPILFCILLAVLSLCPGTQGQQKQEKMRAVLRKAAPARRNGMTDAHFEQWVFQQDGNATGARRRLESSLTLELESIDRACQLNEAQKKKLQLAGHGDIKRFFDRVETVRQRFQLVKDDEQRVNEIWQDIQPLQLSLQAGLFGNDSLLYKSLHNTVTGEQLARYDAATAESREYHRRAAVELVIASLEQATPLRDAQRRQLTTLLMTEVKLPRKSGIYDYHVILLQVSRISDEKLKPLFDEMQWKAVNQQRSQFNGMEQFLKQAGVWPEEDEVDRREDLREGQ
jgi:hypothetical protein